MKILFISNLYPPYFIGGYEQLCHDVATGLKKRGHEVYILTSTYGVNRKIIQDKIFRVLTLEPDSYQPHPVGYIKRILDAYGNFGLARKVVRIVKPEIIFVWNMRDLHRFILNILQDCHPTMAYHISDPWPIEKDKWTIFWEAETNNWIKKIGKSILGTVLLERIGLKINWEALNLKYVSCSCDSLKRQLMNGGLPLKDAIVIHEGIPLDIFSRQNLKTPSSAHNETCSLLYAGQLWPNKGVHTVVRALNHLVKKMNQKNIHLTIIGKGDANYSEHLRSLMIDYNLNDCVTFRNPVPREDLAMIFSQHDILIFPSIWEEPWALTPLIAMACGLAVIGTTTGGSKELFVDGENSLTFLADDDVILAKQINRLIKEPNLRDKISRNGERIVKDKYGIEKMVDKVEQFLKNIIASTD